LPGIPGHVPWEILNTHVRPVAAREVAD
jgi:hypothetical protein